MNDDQNVTAFAVAMITGNLLGALVNAGSLDRGYATGLAEEYANALREFPGTDPAREQLTDYFERTASLLREGC